MMQMKNPFDGGPRAPPGVRIIYTVHLGKVFHNTFGVLDGRIQLSIIPQKAANVRATRTILELGSQAARCTRWFDADIW